MNDVRLLKLLAQKLDEGALKKGKDKEFAGSLVSQWKNKEKLSVKQWFWVRVMLIRAGVAPELVGATEEHMLAVGHAPSKDPAQKFVPPKIKVGDTSRMLAIAIRALEFGTGHPGVRFFSPMGSLYFKRGYLPVTKSPVLAVYGADPSVPLCLVTEEGDMVVSSTHVPAYTEEMWDSLEAVIRAFLADPLLFMKEAGRRYGACPYCGNSLSENNPYGLHAECWSKLEAMK